MGIGNNFIFIITELFNGIVLLFAWQNEIFYYNKNYSAYNTPQQNVCISAIYSSIIGITHDSTRSPAQQLDLSPLHC